MGVPELPNGTAPTMDAEATLRTAFSEVEIDIDYLANPKVLFESCFELLSGSEEDTHAWLPSLLIASLRQRGYMADELLTFLNAGAALLWPVEPAYHKPYGLEKIRARQSAAVLKLCSSGQLQAIGHWIKAVQPTVPEEYHFPALQKLVPSR